MNSLDSARMPSLRDKQRETEEARLKDEREAARQKKAKVELSTNKKKHDKKK